MFGVIKYFIRAVQFVVALLLTVVALTYASQYYSTWRQSHAVPAYVSKSEQVILSVSQSIRNWGSAAMDRLGQPDGAVVLDTPLQHLSDRCQCSDRQIAGGDIVMPCDREAVSSATTISLEHAGATEEGLVPDQNLNDDQMANAYSQNLQKLKLLHQRLNN